METFFPDLKIIPIDHIKLQEYVQKSRMRTLANTIEKEGMLRNPPIVTNFSNSTYMHLDGANRITALSLLKYPQCLVQVVDYSDPSHVRLNSWSHLTPMRKEEIRKKFRSINGIEIKELKQFQHRILLKPYLVAAAVFRDGTTWEITGPSSLLDQILSMGQVVDAYEDTTTTERVFSESPWTPASITVRFDRFPAMQSFFAFPTFSPSQVMKTVDKGVLMPAGITRHVVYRRKLNVNLPLEYLKIEDLDRANGKLQKFLQGRSVRLYEEPIIYFE